MDRSRWFGLEQFNISQPGVEQIFVGYHLQWDPAVRWRTLQSFSINKICLFSILMPSMRLMKTAKGTCGSHPKALVLLNIVIIDFSQVLTNEQLTLSVRCIEEDNHGNNLGGYKTTRAYMFCRIPCLQR